MSDHSSDFGAKQSKQSTDAEQNSSEKNGVQEKSLERMEALLKQSAMGIHVLFQNSEIAEAMRDAQKDSESFNFNNMKKVQDVMTELIVRPHYYEKIAYLNELDKESRRLLIRTYFHIVENTVRAGQDREH